MTVRTLFPRLLIAFFAVALGAGVAAQTNDPDGRPRSALSNKTPIATESLAVPATSVAASGSLETSNGSSLLGRFNNDLLTAIESHLGAPYHYNRTGPESFDCSGFVWRAFQDAGVSFQRGPARSYWAMFAAPSKDEQFKFGTLVFFSGLKHIGIVADEKGFYHSARHGGVVYALFNDYWLARIDGFRRVPLGSMPAPIANHKSRTKPAASAESDDDDNAP